MKAPNDLDQIRFSFWWSLLAVLLVAIRYSQSLHDGLVRTGGHRQSAANRAQQFEPHTHTNCVTQ